MDPRKKKHAVVVVTQDAAVQTKLKLTNSRGGFEGLLQHSKTDMLGTSSKGVIFALEMTSHYWRNLAYFYDDHSTPCCPNLRLHFKDLAGSRARLSFVNLTERAPQVG